MARAALVVNNSIGCAEVGEVSPKLGAAVSFDMAGPAIES